MTNQDSITFLQLKNQKGGGLKTSTTKRDDIALSIGRIPVFGEPKHVAGIDFFNFFKLKAMSSDKKNEQRSRERKMRPLKPIELSQLYEIDKRTFNRWLKPFAKLIGKPNGQFYNILQVKKIFGFLGPPDGFDDSDCK